MSDNKPHYVSYRRLEHSVPGVVSYALQPAKPEITGHLAGIAALALIKTKLPSLIEPSPVFTTSPDNQYPNLNPSIVPWKRWVGFDSCGREVFRIDDRIYFRCHVDSWDSTVAHGSIQDKTVVWNGNLSTEELQELAETLKDAA